MDDFRIVVDLHVTEQQSQRPRSECRFASAVMSVEIKDVQSKIESMS